ncbi:MAG: hypothetical protein KKG10_11990 [Proteobacteria bacterium]|nr:hypothetical protein [Pseudomonadota bacterium]
MNRNLPPNLIEARKLLETFEKSRDHSERTRDFQDAVNILNGYLQDSQDSSHRVVVNNLKRTYTRKLLEELPSLSGLDLYDWFVYTLLLSSVSNEVEELVKDHPNLRKNNQVFYNMWLKDAIPIIEKVMKGGK